MPKAWMRPVVIAGLLMTLAGPATAQGIPVLDQEPQIARVEMTPAQINLRLDDSLQVMAVAYDANGKKLDLNPIFFSRDRRSLRVQQTGWLTALKSGDFELFAVFPYRLASDSSGRVKMAGRTSIEAHVAWPPVQTVEVAGAPARQYEATTIRYGARVVDTRGNERDNVTLAWKSSNDRVASVNGYGDVTAVAPGTATITATGGGVSGSHQVRVAANPARSVTLAADREAGRTGDVIHFAAQVLDARGRPVTDIPVTYSLVASVEDTVIAPAAPAEVAADGRFVAQRAGLYTVIVTAGNLSARHTVSIDHRYNSLRIATEVGHGRVSDAHTSDLWIWSGKDGRDYAVTGTWGADGKAYFWDVTDPTSPMKIDSIQVDARTVNDVKVDEANGICVISREGASNRRNGLVVLDCSDPHHVQVLSRFDDELTGGVHNVFLWNRYVFAINQGRRFDVISLENPREPKRVGFFELDTEGHGIHDIWVVDGIAYTSNWRDGVLLIDVGNGMAGGTPANPVLMGQYKYPIGATHSAFPMRSKSTGKFYVFVGDEQFPYGLSPDDASQAEAGGYIHVVDFSDMKNPKEVARYQVPEAGPHNFWVQNDTLYIAYYNAGLRVVDVSGELMGDLYEQGRELARFKAYDPDGKVANTPMAWGPQPHKGYIFFSDFNSGLWSVQLPQPRRELTP